MTDNKSLVVVPENSGYLKIVSCMSRGELLSNDLSEIRRSSISQESQFVFKTDC